MSSSRAPTISRRSVLGLGLGLALLSGAPVVSAAEPDPEPDLGERCLRIYAPVLDERFVGPYWSNGAYLDDALASLNRLMRDVAAQQEMAIDPRLFDTLHALTVTLDCEGEIELLSGYRTPATNRILQHDRAPQNSLHVAAKAADIRLPGVRFGHAYKAAVGLGAGGVGGYPREDFLHVD